MCLTTGVPKIQDPQCVFLVSLQSGSPWPPIFLHSTGENPVPKGSAPFFKRVYRNDLRGIQSGKHIASDVFCFQSSFLGCLELGAYPQIRYQVRSAWMQTWRYHTQLESETSSRTWKDLLIWVIEFFFRSDTLIKRLITYIIYLYIYNEICKILVDTPLHCASAFKVSVYLYLYIHIYLYIPYSLFRQVRYVVVRCVLIPKAVAACAPPLTFSFGCKICEETVRVTQSFSGWSPWVNRENQGWLNWESPRVN